MLTTMRRNPFSTCRVRPGAIPYVFLQGESADLLINRLRDAGGRGEITGPHGSGKSTLLATLRLRLESQGERPLSIQLHDGERRLPTGWSRHAMRRAVTIMMVDGYEQLGYWARLRLKRFCRVRGVALLVTAHDSVGLPCISRVTTDVERMRAIVAWLAPAADAGVSTGDAVAQYHQHGGDVREALFSLYDLYERRRCDGERAAC